LYKKKDFLEAIAKAREASKKRNFSQSVDLTINFRGIDFKKGTNQIDLTINLPHSTGKTSGVKTLVFASDKSFASQLEGKASKVILEKDIPSLKKKEVEALMKDYGLFLAQGPSMLVVAKNLGQQLAPKGKMPKAIPNNINAFDEMVAKLATSVRVTTKKGKFMPLVHALIGKESMTDDQLAENALEIYTAVFEAINKSPQNLKSVQVKLTMGPVVKLGQLSEVTPQKEKPVKGGGSK
jgi:large subunit ribosomal protein L1